MTSDMDWNAMAWAVVGLGAGFVVAVVLTAILLTWVGTMVDRWRQR